MYFAEIFEKTHVFGIPEPFRTHFKFRSIFEQILQGKGCLPCGDLILNLFLPTRTSF